MKSNRWIQFVSVLIMGVLLGGCDDDDVCANAHPHCTLIAVSDFLF